MKYAHAQLCMHMHEVCTATCLNVEPCFCAGLDEIDIEFPGFGIPLLDGHLPVCVCVCVYVCVWTVDVCARARVSNGERCRC